LDRLMLRGGIKLQNKKDINIEIGNKK